MPADIAEEDLALLFRTGRLAHGHILRGPLGRFRNPHAALEPTHWLPIPPEPDGQ
jgi:hypothetical protein